MSQDYAHLKRIREPTDSRLKSLAMDDVTAYVERLGRDARKAAGELVALDGAAKVAALRKIAAEVRAGQDELLEANAKDISAAEAAGVDAPLVHRLRLDAKKVAAMAE